MNENRKRGRPRFFGRAMTPAECRRRHDARKREKGQASMSEWERSLPTMSDAMRMDLTGAITREELLAGIGDPALKADVAAQFEADEAAVERAANGEVEDE
jgi:hypothetical protein